MWDISLLFQRFEIRTTPQAALFVLNHCRHGECQNLGRPARLSQPARHEFSGRTLQFLTLFVCENYRIWQIRALMRSNRTNHG
jgi:hypothetical protein